MFSKADLQTVLGEPHPAAFIRRVDALERAHVVRRFIRGWYTVPDALDLPTLSQRIAPGSYISFGTVLARALVVGTQLEREIWAAKTGRSLHYEGLGYRIHHLGIAPHLVFGFELDAGVRWATPEKALLDTLYFHLRGQRYPFDIYSDLNLRRLDRALLVELIRHYRNPKFAAFAEGIIHAEA